MFHFTRLTALLAVSAVLWSQPRSAAEAAAIAQINAAITPDEKIAAVENFVRSFPDSAYKATELTLAASAADKKADFGRAIWYGELAIQADPADFYAMLLVAGELAQHTGPKDADKEEKLAKAESFIAQALSTIPTAVPPTNGVSYEKWEALKTSQTATAHKDLGLVAEKRAEWKLAAQEYQRAIDTDPTDQVTMARLSNAENEIGWYAEALATASRVLALNNLNPTVRSFAEQQRTRAEKGWARQQAIPNTAAVQDHVAAPSAVAAPATLSLGMSVADVVAILGQPDRVADVGTKKIYVFKNLKVTFVNGQATDIN